MKGFYFEKLVKLAIKASKKNEVPVAALIVKNNKIVAKAYNKRESLNFAFAHAEILCIKKASRRLKTWKLMGCDMYVTLKPCKMCASVIQASRIENVYYLLNNNKVINTKTKFEQVSDFNCDNYKKLLTSFFSSRR